MCYTFKVNIPSNGWFGINHPNFGTDQYVDWNKGVQKLDDILKEIDTANGGNSLATATIPFDAKTNKWSYDLDIPGYAKSDVSIEVNGTNLEIVASNATRAIKEFVLEFPESANLDATEATVKDGVLTISVPKKAEPAPKKIAVN
jgi:HSP20 family molecular chaperone IbpA